MANLVIKKNFADGDKLFAQQLNNNFETIEKAINDGNKIVWQDGTEVKFKRYVTNDIDSLPILDGSIIYDTAKGRQYIDYKGQRIQVGSAGREVIIQEAQPTEEDNKIWIDSDVINTMGTEIMNEHSDSKIMGYSANYLNERLTKVSLTEPTTGEEVWIQKSNNVFNEEYAKNASNYAKFGTLTSVGYNSIPIYLEPNTTYTFSRTDNAGLGSGYYCLLKLDGNTNASSDDNSKWIIHNTTANQNNQNFTFTTLDNGLVLLTVGYEDNLTQNTLNNIWAVLKEVQIEQGETATTYEPYIDKKIFVKNENDVYEKFYDEVNLTTGGIPVKCDYKVDGKDVYVKRVNLGSIEQKGSYEISHNLPSNITILKIEGTMKEGTLHLPLPFYTSDSTGVIMFIYGNNIIIEQQSLRISATGNVDIYFTYN